LERGVHLVEGVVAAHLGEKDIKRKMIVQWVAVARLR
jgi:hypothetical protein